ncbi:MAG: pyrroline-5-carboxylate reductase [Burkholderiaceae bacterium]|nr:pyrroline-5-carboxylate reductase [Burkholderiaceae bacterium]
MQITFIGGGNMAAALIGGMIARGTPAASVRVIEPVQAQRDALHRRFGVSTFAQAHREALGGADLVVVAVKPQQMREALMPLATLVRDALVVSVAAGIRARDMSRWLGGHRRIVRAMPNTPALIGMGVTGLAALAGVDEADRATAEHALGAVGPTVWVDDESLLDAVTAVSGSGPAYVFLLMEAMQEAALALGLDAAQARTLTLNTVAGAAQLALRSDEPPATLRERVTSKGGTTAAALAVLEAGGLRDLMARALAAAQRRSVEMGDEFGRDD